MNAMPAWLALWAANVAATLGAIQAWGPSEAILLGHVFALGMSAGLFAMNWRRKAPE